LLNLRELSAVPIARYFVVVGSALVVLLLIAGGFLPESPASFSGRPESIERTAIRIRSDHKWPESVVLDTSQPTTPTPSIEVAPSEPLAAPLPDEMTDQTRVEPLARPIAGAQPIDAQRPARAKRKLARAFASAHMARTHHRSDQPTLGTSEECCRFGWPDRPATSKAAPRRRVARRDSGWHFPEAN
jgi:hypothetical protein